MKNRESTARVVRDWVEKAENDLKNAAHTLKLGSKAPTDTVCFHAQQTVEKYLKALLVWRGIDFPKTHDIQTLMTLVPKIYKLNLTDSEQEKLTDYATVTRYPGDYDPISLSEARQAVTIARRVKKEIRKVLPRESLKPPA